MPGHAPRRIDPAEAAPLLRRGAVVVYPTEAVWGIGCDPLNDDAVQRLLRIKQRPVAKGMIVVCDDLARVADWVDLDALPPQRRGAVLASWPGPNTWTLPATARAPRMLCGDHATLAVRVSAHPVVVAICAAFGGAVVSTSANRAGLAPAFDEPALDPDLLSQVDAVVAGATGGLAAPTPIRDARSGDVLRG